MPGARNTSPAHTADRIGAQYESPPARFRTMRMSWLPTGMG